VERHHTVVAQARRVVRIVPVVDERAVVRIEQAQSSDGADEGLAAGPRGERGDEAVTVKDGALVIAE